MINVGEDFLHYRVLSRIGTGGMGEVFLARDTNLGRKVAIKILRKKYGQDKEGLRRFIQEAKTSSALNHPNIITIYEIGEYEDSNYISSEYIEGKTLHTRLGKEPMQLNEILRIAMQVVEAIAAAHAAGIVHRDIKPENVMIRADGYVKVLDFGLAKLTEQNHYSGEFDNESETMVETNPGMILGTVAYMSPEQARGRGIDSRSDIWSVGVVLYEMITGIRPFTGETTSDVLAAILRSHPPDMEPYGVPIELEHIVSKALRKDRDERYQNIRDMLIDLKDLSRELDLESRSGRVSLRNTGGRGLAPTTAEITQQPVSTAEVIGPATHSISDLVISQFRLHPKGMTAGIAVLILALAAGVFGFKLWYDRPAAAHSFEKMKLSKLVTFANNNGTTLAVSPDGKYVSYVESEGKLQGLWVRHIGTGSNVEIVPKADVEYGGISYSKDGDFVYFGQRQRGEDTSVYRVAALGGPVKKVVAGADAPIGFSPNGSKIVFSRRDKEVWIANLDGTEPKLISTAPEGQLFTAISWSPDLNEVIAAGYSTADANTYIFRISVADGSITPFGNTPWFSINAIAFDPAGDGLYLSGRDIESQRMQIWRVAYPDGAISRVTNDLSNYEGISVSGDGKSLATVQSTYAANIYVRENGKNGVERKVTSDVGRDNGLSGVAWTPDGRIVYTARTVGSQDLWIVNSDGSGAHQITSESGKNFHPAVSPDGSRIAFVSTRAGNVDLWTMNIDGTDPIQLTRTSEIEGRPQYTPDGKWIIYDATNDNDVSSLWKMSAGGGEAVRLTDADAWRPAISPDGKTVAVKYKASPEESGWRIGLLPLDGGDAKLFDAPSIVGSGLFRWDGSDSLIFMETVYPGSGTELHTQSLGVSKEAVLASKSPESSVFYFDVSRNGKGIALARGNRLSEAVVITNFR